MEPSVQNTGMEIDGAGPHRDRSPVMLEPTMSAPLGPGRDPDSDDGPAQVQSLIDEMRTCLRDIGRVLRARLFPNGESVRGQVADVFAAFAGLMERDVAALAACARDMQNYQAPDTAACCDDAVTTLRDALLRVRGLLTATYGPQAAEECGLSGPVPEEPEPLARYSQRAAALLERAASSYATPAPFVSFDLRGAAGFLRERMQVLQVLQDAGEGRALRDAEERYAELIERCMEHRDVALALIEALAPLAALGPQAERLRRRAAVVKLASALEPERFASAPVSSFRAVFGLI